MAGQGIERREVLRMLAIGAWASQFPGFSRWTYACEHLSPGPAQIRPAEYTPQFFSPSEYATLERLTELIIPSDGKPGAREAGVAEFVDFMVSAEKDVQYRFRYGLDWLDAHAKSLDGKTFMELSAGEETEVLEHLAYKEKHRSGEEDGREFFQLVRRYTTMGFYTSRIGMEQLDYPGLRLYSESIGCPHKDDPEHKHLGKEG
jgi:gluconate 2-dehydrogenase subunit 3-like protein